MLSVVIPALNEEAAIGATVREVRHVLQEAGIVHEIIVVDDGSQDRTGEIASEAGASVLRHVHNLGYGRSLKDGIAVAEYPAIAIADADGTYPLHEIPRLLALYQNGYHMVVGARTGEHYRGSSLKSPLRTLLRWLVELTAARPIEDINSGFRVFSRDHARAYSARLCETFSFTTGLTLAFMMNALFVHYTPIEYNERIGQSKVHLFRDSARTVQYIFEAAVYYNPLRIFLLMASLLNVVALFMIIVNFPFQSTALFLIAVGFSVTSILVFALGLLAVLLKQILDVQASNDRRA